MDLGMTSPAERAKVPGCIWTAGSSRNDVMGIARGGVQTAKAREGTNGLEELGVLDSLLLGKSEIWLIHHIGDLTTGSGWRWADLDHRRRPPRPP